MSSAGVEKRRVSKQRGTVGERGPQAKRKDGAAQPIGQKDKKKEEEEERYVVVITNVENDFARVHQEAVLRFCCLDTRHCRGAGPHVSLSGASNNNKSGNKHHEVKKENASSLASAPAIGDRRQCYYDVSARSETRSVEVSIYGTADGDVSSVYLPNGHNVHDAESGKKKTAHDYNRKKAKMETTQAGAKEKQEENDDAVVECVHSRAGGKTVFASPEHMVMALRGTPYFTHPPTILLNVAGKENGDILCKAKLRKRHRGDDEQRTSGDGNGSSEAKDPQDVLQSTVRQTDMVTAIAATSSRILARELRNQLSDIPGFVTCWLLHPQHFRLVFATKSALFKAKELLDQFTLDGHVRVSLTLPDDAAKEFVNYLALEENVGEGHME